MHQKAQNHLRHNTIICNVNVFKRQQGKWWLNDFKIQAISITYTNNQNNHASNHAQITIYNC